MAKANSSSHLVKVMWNAAVLGGMVSLWQLRNKIRFDEDMPDFEFCQKMIRNHVLNSVRISKATSENRVADLVICRHWNVPLRPAKAPTIKECFWRLPEQGMMKINVDGASRGNPGNAGWGALFRDETGFVRLVVSKGLGVCTSFQAECFGILESIEIAIDRGWKCIMLESDSQAAVEAFLSNEVPWVLKARWRACRAQVTKLNLIAVWRESNFGADQAAKHGASMNSNETALVEGIPHWIKRIENEHTVYFRFC